VDPCLLAMDGSFVTMLYYGNKDTVKMYILYFQHGEIGCGGWRIYDVWKRFSSFTIFFTRPSCSQNVINQRSKYLLYKK